MDREAAEPVLAVTPGLRWRVRANRAFPAGDPGPGRRGGIGQFLDLGTGIPGTGNTHEVARRVPVH
ncbi:MAG TPA: SAM-dependent methyltransferase [Streptosporangiaceae bacterium]|nr:SAM-dependent methyltransferase [Streptosporangiaceae bacterium]